MRWTSNDARLAVGIEKAVRGTSVSQPQYPAFPLTADPSLFQGGRVAVLHEGADLPRPVFRRVAGTLTVRQVLDDDVEVPDRDDRNREPLAARAVDYAMRRSACA
jgi:hypothetical protein